MAPTHMLAAGGYDPHLLEPGDQRQRARSDPVLRWLFDVRLRPGESSAHTFTTKGSFFFNDSFNPRLADKIEVY